MERSAEIILSEIKECLGLISQKLSELEALQAAVPAPEPREEVPAPTEPVDLDIDLPEEEAPVAGPSVLDVVTRSRAWEVDMPGSPVANILSAISLNDRLLFINTLFKKDPVLFQDSIKDLNSMDSLQQALDYISENFSEWQMESDIVYRFMMAVRRKLS